ncbi:T9SS type A sorting domain-containing protein, partial [Flavobacterium psychrophilum]
SALKIYPNPVSEILNIALQEGLQLQKVNFYNTLGQLIKTTNHLETNVSSFAKGNYFVEVITNQGKATKTIIIQ